MAAFQPRQCGVAVCVLVAQVTDVRSCEEARGSARAGRGRVPVGHGLLNPSFYWLVRLFYLACTILCNVNKSPL